MHAIRQTPLCGRHHRQSRHPAGSSSSRLASGPTPLTLRSFDIWAFPQQAAGWSMRWHRCRAWHVVNRAARIWLSRYDRDARNRRRRWRANDVRLQKWQQTRVPHVRRPRLGRSSSRACGEDEGGQGMAITDAAIAHALMPSCPLQPPARFRQADAACGHLACSGLHFEAPGQGVGPLFPWALQ